MPVRLLALAAVLLASVAPARAQTSFPVTFRFLPDLTTPVVTPVVRAFVPGSFNDWGPNTAGNIVPTAPSRMAYDAALNEYRYTTTLTVGTDYFYKVHYHRNETAPSYGGTWISDPLNPRLGPTDGNSAVLVTDPMAFQLAREQEGTTEVRVVSASLFGTQPFTQITYEVNGDVFTDGMTYYNATTHLFRKPLATPVAEGAQFRIVATDAAGRTVEAEVGVTPPVVVDAPVPAGLVDGINLYPGDPTRATLVLRAPNKRFVHAIGDFSGWAPQDAYVLKRDTSDPRGTRWWVELTGLTAGQPVRFQYLVDGVIRVSDPYAPLVLDEGSDPFITATTFPNRPPYPVGLTSQLVAVFTPGAPAFAWTDGAYERQPTSDLVVYEMIVRDFVAAHDFQTVRDTLDYLQTLGVTALELMPVSEFDGNLNWGYGPNHYLAVDKYYGPPEALKALIDEAHARGMAVILDVVYNHQTGQAPFVRLYNEGEFGIPTPDNPWVNPTGRHPFNVFNDNNHEAPLTEVWLDRANRWWLEEYHVDGFRYDLSKGFTQTCNGGTCTDANFSAYNQARIDNLTRMADAVWAVDPDAYLILEHFADPSEERVLANHGRAAGRPGMMLWSNMNRAYSQSAMGFLSDGSNSSDLSRAYPPNNGYPLTGQITYAESHDEQWLMFRTRSYGASQGTYNTRALPTALDRQALAYAFLLTVPGPKMLWQFGELGYGFGNAGEQCLRNDGANECPATAPGRTDAKPIRWDYFSDPERFDLYRDVHDVLFLRNTYDVFRTPSSVQMQVGQGQPDRWIRLEKNGLRVVVAGNFGLAERTQTPLPAGTWYEVFSRNVVVSDGSAPVTLAPGEYRIYATQELMAPPVVTADEGGAEGEAGFSLASVFPNPTAGRATVRYTLPEGADVRLDAYDVLGRRVATLAEGAQGAGAHEASLDASALPAGVYVLRLTAGSRTTTARVTVAR
ncbi:MAG TPA: alpha-amylase family glycosyl hydrolase [Rubricoccaceae bacterium]